MQLRFDSKRGGAAALPAITHWSHPTYRILPDVVRGRPCILVLARGVDNRDKLTVPAFRSADPLTQRPKESFHAIVIGQGVARALDEATCRAKTRSIAATQCGNGPPIRPANVGSRRFGHLGAGRSRPCPSTLSQHPAVNCIVGGANSSRPGTQKAARTSSPRLAGHGDVHAGHRVDNGAGATSPAGRPSGFHSRFRPWGRNFGNRKHRGYRGRVEGKPVLRSRAVAVSEGAIRSGWQMQVPSRNIPSLHRRPGASIPSPWAAVRTSTATRSHPRHRKPP